MTFLAFVLVRVKYRDLEVTWGKRKGGHSPAFSAKNLGCLLEHRQSISTSATGLTRTVSWGWGGGVVAALE